MAIFGLILVLFVFTFVVGLVVGIVSGVGRWEYAAQQWLKLGVGLVLSTLSSVAFAVSYHALRQAKEGIGIEELAAVFD